MGGLGMKKRLIVGVLLSAFVLLAVPLGAEQFKVALVELPSSANIATFFTAMGEATNNTFDVQIVPSARAVYLIDNKQVDIMYPSTHGFDAKKNAAQNHDFSSVTISKAVLVLYSNKNKPVDVADLKKGNTQKRQIETAGSLTGLFEFDPIQSTNVENSLKKIDAGTIDGYIYIQFTGDATIKKLDLKNIRRDLYGIADTVCALQKGAAGGPADKALTDGLAATKKNGKFLQIMGQYIQGLDVYDDWQP
jgi:polar amino acid transport system substrate-binding protein